MGAPRSRLAADGLLAAGFAAVPHLTGLQPMTVWAWVLSIVAAAPLVVRRKWPVPVFAVAVTAALAGLAFGPGSLPAAAFALYTVQESRPARQWPSIGFVGGVCAVGAMVLAVGGTSEDGSGGAASVVLAVVLLGGAWIAGQSVAQRRENAARAIERARLDERMRIARDMHDIMTHSIGLIVVKAGVANHVVGSHPDEAKNALTVIEEVGRKTLGEMRTMLGVLRGEAEVGGLEPAPRLSDLPMLAETARARGVQVELAVRGSTDVPESVEIAAFRILQEALNNVVRHAAPTRCRVLVEGEPGSLALEISDDGPSGGGAIGVGRDGRDAGGEVGGRGYGLLGVRERAQAHGGTVVAGPRADGGFTLRTTLRF